MPTDPGAADKTAPVAEAAYAHGGAVIDPLMPATPTTTDGPPTPPPAASSPSTTETPLVDPLAAPEVAPDAAVTSDTAPAEAPPRSDRSPQPHTAPQHTDDVDSPRAPTPVSPVWERDFADTTTSWNVGVTSAGPADQNAAIVNVRTGDSGTPPDQLPPPTAGPPTAGPPTAGPPTAGPTPTGTADPGEDTSTPPAEPRPPWERFGSAEDFPTRLAAKSTQLIEPADTGPTDAGPADTGPTDADATMVGALPAAPPNDPDGSASTRRRDRRPLWRDEVHPDDTTPTARPPAARRSPPPPASETVAKADERGAESPSGLPSWVAVLLGVCTTTAAGALDLFWNGQIGIFFTVCFGILAFVVAATIRRTDFFTALVLPPLELLVTLVVLGLIVPERLNPAANGWFDAVMSSLAASWVALIAAVAITLGMLVIRWALRPTPPDDSGPS